MATLKDYQNEGVMEPERFYVMYKDLKPEEYKAKILEVYGQPGGRDKKMEAMVNVAVLAYAAKK
jgi:hypothetical protein